MRPGVDGGARRMAQTALERVAILKATTALTDHTHEIADIDGLQAALDSKQPIGSYVLSSEFLWDNLGNKPSTFPPSPHTHGIADVTGLQAALDTKANLSGGTFTGKVTLNPGPANDGLDLSTNDAYLNCRVLRNPNAAIPGLYVGYGGAGAINLYAGGTTLIATVSGLGLDVTVGALSQGGINASLEGHTHDYLPLTGGTLTGPLTGTVFKGSYYQDAGGTTVLNPVGPKFYGDGYGFYSRGGVQFGAWDVSGLSVYSGGSLARPATVQGLYVRNAGASSGYSGLVVQTGAGAALDVRNNGDVRALGALYSNGVKASLEGHTHTSDAITDLPALASGTYTPTKTGSVALDASTVYPCQWMRVGNVVTVSGRIDLDATATGGVRIELSVPIPSNFTASDQAAGTAAAIGASQALAIYALSATQKVRLEGIASSTANQAHMFSFTYQVE